MTKMKTFYTLFICIIPIFFYAQTFTAPDDVCVDVPTFITSLAGSPTGGVYSGPGVTNIGDGINFLFNPAMAGVGVHTLTYTQGGNAVTDDIEVFALPTVSFTALADLSISAGVQNNLGGGSPNGGVYSGPGVTDDGNGMTYDFDPAGAGVGTHTLTYNLTDSNGCTNSASDDVMVTGSISVTFTAPADVCLNDGLHSMLGGGLPVGGVYSGPGVTDNNDGMTYSFDPAAAGVGIHNITYTVSPTAFAIDDIEVFALPAVSLNIPATQDEFCLDAGVELINLAGNPTGLGVFSGPGVTNLGNGGISFTFTPANAGVGTHTIMYTFTDANGCSNVGTDEITVNDLPVVMFTASADLCLDAGVQSGLGGGTPAGIDGFIGVYSGDGVTDDGNGTTYSFDPAAAGVGVHQISYTFTDGNGCTNSASDDVEVLDLDNVIFTAPADLCIDAGVQTGLSGGSPVTSDPTITWTLDEVVFSDGGTATGYFTVDPMTNGIIDWTTTVSGGNTGIFTPITYTTANSTASFTSGSVILSETGTNRQIRFEGDSDMFVCAPINNLTAGAIGSVGNVECFTCSPFRSFSGQLIGSCTIYSGPGVTDDGNGMTYSFDPAAAGVGVHTITYTYFEDGCSGSASDDIEVFALPTVSLSTAIGYCLDTDIANFAIVGGSPAGGVYSGPGVTDLGNGINYNFDPMVAGTGIHVIEYTITDANGCVNTASSNLEVFDCDFSITDPCGCLDNATVIDIDAGTGGDDGQFSEVVSIVNATGMPLPNGQTWTVVGATGAIDANSVPPIGTQSPGVPIATNGSVTLNFNDGNYELPFVHLDAVGYTMMITGPFPVGSPVNVTLNISNNCSYPNPIFDPTLSNLDLCAEDPSFTLGGTDTDGIGADGISFTINGNPATVFDPVALGGGNHTVVMSYDGAADAHGAIAPMGSTSYPGCVQTVQQVVFVDPICCMLVVDCSNITDQPLECRADLPPVDFNLVNAIDSCGDVTKSALTIIPGNSGCPGDPIIITREYFLNDGVSSESCMQTFTVESTIAPTITCPANVTIECDEDNSPANTGMATGTAYCSTAAIVTFSDVSTQGTAGCSQYEYMITRTWTATDNCNRMATCSQIITVDDTQGPVITCPANLTIECDEDTSPSNTGMATGSDNCSAIAEIVITSSDISTQGTSGCSQYEYIITRTWLSMDACGNSSTCSQVITVKDNDPPVITCPANLTIECDEDTSPSNTGMATGFDNCSAVSEVVITSSDVYIWLFSI